MFNITKSQLFYTLFAVSLGLTGFLTGRLTGIESHLERPCPAMIGDSQNQECMDVLVKNMAKWKCDS